MKVIRSAAAFLVLAAIGCGDDSGTVPDVGVKKEASVASEAGPKPDLGPAPDGVKPDAPKPSPDGPRPDGAKPSDGPKPDGAPKPDAPKPSPDGPKTACTPNPCLNGGTCSPTSSGFSCACSAGWKGTTCQTASFCDVVYRVTGVFKTTDAPIIGQFTKNVGANAATPPFNPARTTPFTPAAFAAGFMRLRFPSLNGAPAAGPVKIIEFYMPMEFSVSSLGTNVNTDIDQSAGMLALAGTPPQIGDPPALDRVCGPVATGTLTGTTLSWGACSAVPDNTTSWTFAKAVSNDPGCLHRMSTWGNVVCTSGMCGLVTGTGNQRQTWDQKLNSFVFSGTNYATATFTMAEVQTPNVTSVKTFSSYSATSVLKVECDNTAALTCDEK